MTRNLIITIEEGLKISPLADLLADTGRELITLSGIKILTTKEKITEGIYFELD